VEFFDFGTTDHSGRRKATIKIEDGCNNFCSYCIIPYAKGRVRSREAGSIINEIKDAVSNGIKEVVITGIHIASYRCRGDQWSPADVQCTPLHIGLIDLLEEINSIQGLQKINLGSLEPTIITEDFVMRLKKLDKICSHFHLSLQSGCNETLKRMNRKYTVEEFEKSVEILRSAFPEAVVTTDIIVGFPGETDDGFNETYRFLEHIKFAKMHVFKYSPRKGTPAAEMSGQLNESVKEARSKKLIELSNKYKV